jgi:hypothetical protein
MLVVFFVPDDIGNQGVVVVAVEEFHGHVHGVFSDRGCVCPLAEVLDSSEPRGAGGQAETLFWKISRGSRA